MRNIPDEDVLAERIEYVLDTTSDRVVDLLWSRAVGGHEFKGEWVLVAEEYSSRARAIAYREEGLPLDWHYRTMLIEDKIAAESLFEGLKNRML